MSKNCVHMIAALLAVSLAGCAGSGSPAAKAPGGKTGAGSTTGSMGVDKGMKAELGKKGGEEAKARQGVTLTFKNSSPWTVLFSLDGVDRTGWIGAGSSRTIDITTGDHVLKAQTVDGVVTTASMTAESGMEYTWTVWEQ